MGETFLIDIHANQYIYLDDPNLYVPEGDSGRLRKPSRYKTNLKSQTVSTFVSSKKQMTGKKSLSINDSVDLLQSTLAKVLNLSKYC